MKYLNFELEGQLGLSKKVYENVDFRKSLLRTEINLGYVGAGKLEGIGLGQAIGMLEDSSRYINHGERTLDIQIDVSSYIKRYCKVVRDESGAQVSSIELVSFNYATDENIKVPDITRTKNVADTYLNGIMPKRYGCKSDGTMTKEQAVKWIYQAIWKHANVPESKLKEVLELMKDTEYHLYALHDGMPEVACLIAERTNTSSCMTEHSLNAAFAKFRHIRTNKDGKEVWLHPFRAYEHEDNVMYCVSTLPPEKVLGVVHDKVPFIARAFSNDREVARWYGSSEQNWWNVFGEYVDESTPLGMELYAYEVGGRNIIPYIDGSYDVTDRYLNSVQAVGYADENKTPAGIDARIVRITDRDEDCEGGYYACCPSNGFMEWESTREEHECAVSGDWYDEEDMIYVEDLNDWVHEEYARYDSDRGYYLLDGLAVYNYYN